MQRAVGFEETHAKRQARLENLCAKGHGIAKSTLEKVPISGQESMKKRAEKYTDNEILGFVELNSFYLTGWHGRVKTSDT